jgi:hypothetical protein
MLVPSVHPALLRARRWSALDLGSSGTESREVVAAVNIAAHSSMISMEELVDALGPHLVSAADNISARLGYRRDDEQASQLESPTRPISLIGSANLCIHRNSTRGPNSR